MMALRRATKPHGTNSLMLAVIVPMTLLGVSFAATPVMSSVDQTDEELSFGIRAWVWRCDMARGIPRYGPRRTANGNNNSLSTLWRGDFPRRHCKVTLQSI